MNQRFLILNADDFGISESVNRAVDTLARQRLITSASLLAPAPFAGQAAVLAKGSGIACGVHWTLRSEWADAPWPPCGAPDLSFCQGANLPQDPHDIARAKARAVSAELRAQLRSLAERGLALDHADSHGTDLYGINGRLFFIAAFKICARHALPFRFAKNPAFLTRMMGGSNFAITAAHRLITTLAALMGVRLLDDMISDPRRVKDIGGYDDLAQYYRAALAAAPAGITEVFLHPSEPDAALLSHTAEWQKREWEYRLLQSGDLIQFAQREGFMLTSWGGAPFYKKTGDAP